MTQPDPVSTAVTLLRQLAGRVADTTLATWRSYLAAREMAMLGDSMAVELHDERVALSDEEHIQLSHLLAPNASGPPRQITDAPQPIYDFVTSHGPAPTEVDGWVINGAKGIPQVRRVLRAFRRPANDTEAMPATWIYLVELDPGSDVTRPQNWLRIPDPSTGVVEVYAAGEHLPPYQSAALAAAIPIWTR